MIPETYQSGNQHAAPGSIHLFPPSPIRRSADRPKAGAFGFACRKAPHRRASCNACNGTVPRGIKGYDGCYFFVSLTSTPISASVRVYDIQPRSWSSFFKDLAENWKGWVGEKGIKTLEGRWKCQLHPIL